MNEIFDDIKQEGESSLETDEQFEALFNGEQEENPGESSPEETENGNDSEQSEDNKSEETSNEEETEDKTEKNVPFHEHPRWKKQQEELKELRDFKESYSELAEKVDTLQQKTESTTTNIPMWWQKLYGDDEISAEAYSEYQSHESELRAEIKKQTIEEYRAEQSAAAEESKKLDKWIENEISTLKAEGNDFNRNELLKVATEMQPTDSDGNISLRKSLEILNLQKASQSSDKGNDERKKVAAMTSSDNQGSETNTSKAPQLHSLRGKSMQELLHGK